MLPVKVLLLMENLLLANTTLGICVILHHYYFIDLLF